MYLSEYFIVIHLLSHYYVIVMYEIAAHKILGSVSKIYSYYKVQGHDKELSRFNKRQ